MYIGADQVLQPSFIRRHTKEEMAYKEEKKIEKVYLRSRNNRSSKREPWQDLRRQHKTSYQMESQGQILGVSVDCFDYAARCC